MTSPAQAIRDHVDLYFATLPYVETVNANPADRPAGGFVALEFMGGTESLASIGTPGANRHRRKERALAHIFTPVGMPPQDVEARAIEFRAALRGARIPFTGGTVRIDGVMPSAVEIADADGRFFRATMDVEYWYDING